MVHDTGSIENIPQARSPPVPEQKRFLVTRTFRQVDVFAPGPLPGNPVAVVHDAEGMSDSDMLSLARWTNLSETTFLLGPRSPEADYRLRIFTPAGELPFAGHPTLGSAHAWLEEGGEPRDAGALVQECEAGLITLRPTGGRLAFAAPPLTRYEDAVPEIRQAAVRCLRISPERVRSIRWIDNGPGWLGVLLRSAQDVLDLEPDMAAIDEKGLKLGVAGFFDAEAAPADIEVRAFVGSGDGPAEDPVTGSLNAGLAQWLMEQGLAPDRYVARQGTRLGRGGFVHVVREAGETWISGATRTVVSGHIDW